MDPPSLPDLPKPSRTPGNNQQNMCLDPVVFVSEKIANPHTPGSINSLFSDFVRELWRGILGGVRDYFGEVLEVSRGQMKGNKR